MIACCEVPITIIEPTAWKKSYRLRGKDKEGSRQRALELFPAAHAVFARKKDHGRAEAALIALTFAASSATAPKLSPLCVECGTNRADPPSRLCPGCQAYVEYQA